MATVGLRRISGWYRRGTEKQPWAQDCAGAHVVSEGGQPRIGETIPIAMAVSPRTIRRLASEGKSNRDDLKERTGIQIG
jgi:hypothetical protein